MGVCNCSMFCCTLLYVHSSIGIILMGKRELIALLNLSSWCLVMVERLFLTVPRGCLQFVIVVFPDHTHLLCAFGTGYGLITYYFLLTLPRQCFLCGSFLAIYIMFSLQPFGHQLGRTGFLARLYVKFSCVLPVSHVVSWVRCSACLY